ncbi:MAG TPA: preprotein translocase subunit SecA [Candidatus Methylacidiphilales bacterium]|nr:preprotein translocase subunit SecA [Candidatus Methylacidiphilales bacterium]
MIKWIVKKVLGTKNQREVKRLVPLVEKINRLEEEYRDLMDEQLVAKTTQFKDRLAKGETLDDILPEAFAVVKNACRRLTERKHAATVRGQTVIWEMIPFDVQLIGGMVLHSGRIAEMATGEGKTLVATFPAYLNALTGRGVHVVTVNDYLAARDSEWMGEIYRFLNLTVGCVQHGQTPDTRRQQYQCDITYGTNSEMGFDYLRDNGMATSKAEQVQRGHVFAIVDEVDSILIDEARVPLIIAGPATVSTHQFDKFKGVIERLVQAQNLEANRWAADARRQADEVNMEETGRLLFKIKNSMPRNKQLLKMIEDPALRRAMDDAELALYQDPRKTDLYRLKEEAYFSIDEKANEADLSEKGRNFLNPNDPEMFVLPDLITRFHDIEHDEKLSKEEKQRAKALEQQKYDQASERIHNISQLLRAYCVFEKDVHYVVQENKVVIVDENTGRALPGRRWSDGLHQAVEAKEGVQIDRETQTLATITIQNYFRLYQKLSGMTGTAETEANEFHDIYKLDVVVIPTNRPIARVDLDDSVYKTRNEKLKAIIKEIKAAHARGQPVLVGTIAVESSEVISRMLKREGIVHNVLNAKFVQQEAEIVAQAGQRGAVTIATNMAGRGTDIKLGAGVNKIQGLYVVNAKNRVVETIDSNTVIDETNGEHATSGLYVIGTERHESRRIDRQLRGRCARQGDPGVSKFYVSFEDDLMRNFADSRRLSSLMTKMGMKDDEDLQHPMLNRSVEGAQRRVEERNYVSRKYTLQFDDVMNQQRTVIYSWRNDILTTETPRDEIFEVVQEVLEEQTEARLTGPEPDTEGFLSWLNSTFPVAASAQDFDFAAGSEAVVKAAQQRIRDAYEIKIKFEDPKALQSLERYTLLGAIDRLWQEHLYAIDSLRQSIQLRAMGQRDPLIEYKREAFTMFSDLMGRIKHEISSSLFRTSASITAFESFLRSIPQKFIHETPPSALSTPAEPITGLPGTPQDVVNGASETPPPERKLPPIRKTGPAPGRNDPCPCGSGKKYKNCCGK